MRFRVCSLRSRFGIGLLALAVVACGPPENGGDGPPGPPPVFDEDLRQRITVSGISSGGHMAVQTHVALSDRIGGVATVAGGPYHCAEGSVTTALGRCLSGENLDVAGLVSHTRDAAAAGHIAGVPDDSNVWIFHSPKDSVVSQTVSVGLLDFYRAFVPQERIRFVDDVEAAHGWPTVDSGGDCLTFGGDFINACGYDTAGELLGHLYDALQPAGNAANDGALLSIELADYFDAGSGLADAGYIYVPNSCRASEDSCRFHLAFHGCRQGDEFIEDRFALNAGLNEWASTNQIVILYPQIESSLMNPQGCWDWWGYTGSNYDTRNGKQIAGINAIIAAFAGQTLYPAGEQQ